MVVPISPLNTLLTTLDAAKIRFTPSDVLDFLSKVLHKNNKKERQQSKLQWLGVLGGKCFLHIR